MAFADYFPTGRAAAGGILVIVAGIAACSSEAKSPLAACRVNAVSVAPANPTVEVQSNVQLSANVASTGCSATPPVVWQSSATQFATVTSTGVVTGVAQGTATISATSEGISGSTQVQVISAAIATIEITPPSPVLRAFETLALTAVPKDSRGQVLTGRTITWTTLSPSIVTVNQSTGVITGVSVGQGVVVATGEGITRQANVTVTEAAPASVVVTLAASSINVGRTTQATGTARDVQGNPVSGQTLIWSSATPEVATVNASGLVTGVSAGTASIRASVNGFPNVIGQATVSVQGAFAIGVANSPLSSSYTVPGVNTAGGTIIATRFGVGLYSLQFNSMGTQGGLGLAFTMLVNATASAPNAALGAPTARCNGLFGSVLQPLTFEVRCEDPATGAAKDAAFRAVVVGDRSLGRTGFPFAFTLHDNSTNTPYAPGVFFSFNSAASPMSINRFVPGSVEVIHDQGAVFSDRRAVMTSVFDGSSFLSCQPAITPTTTSALVRCGTNNADVGAVHTVLSTTAGRPGFAAGYAQLKSDGALQDAFSFTSGTTISTTRSAVGRYTIVFNGMNASTGQIGVLVTPWFLERGQQSGFATNQNGMYCSHFLVSNNPVTVDVACFGRDLFSAVNGVFRDTPFGVLILQ